MTRPPKARPSTNFWGSGRTLWAFSAFYKRAAVNFVDDLGVRGFVTDKHFRKMSNAVILRKIAFMRIKALLAVIIASERHDQKPKKKEES